MQRLIWTTGFTMSEEVADVTDLPVGRLAVFGSEDCADDRVAYVRTCDGRVLKVNRIKIEGGVENPPCRAAKKAGMIDHSIRLQNTSMTGILLSTDSFAGK